MNAPPPRSRAPRAVAATTVALSPTHATAVVVAGVTLAVLVAGRAHGGSFVFSEPVEILFPNDHFPTQIALGDVNGDERTDLVVPGRDVDGLAYVLLAQPDGSFADPEPFVVGGQTDWCELRDVNGDGHLDAVFARRSAPGQLAVSAGNGDGTFAESPDLTSGGREPRGLFAGDLDGDTDVDVAILDYSGARIRILLNDGSGAYAEGSSERLNEYVGGLAFPQQVLGGDLDGDDDLDLVVTAIGAGRVNILFNRGDGTFEQELAYRPPLVEKQQPGITNSALTDMDGDGDLDLVTSYILAFQTQYVGILPNDGAGGFPSVETFVAAPSGISWVPQTADLDGDGDEDVVVGYALPGAIGLLASDGASPPSLDPVQIIELGSFIRDIRVLDVDGDDDLDLLLADAPGHRLLLLLNETPQGMGAVAAGGSPAIDAATAIDVETDPTRRAMRGRRIDRDGDGDVDGVDLALELARMSVLPGVPASGRPESSVGGGAR